MSCDYLSYCTRRLKTIERTLSNEYTGSCYTSDGEFVITINHIVSPDREEEIAEIKPTSVTHGKTYHSEDVYAAAHAIDKDLSTAAATVTGNGAGWLKLEFGTANIIHKVVIHYMFYTNWYEPDSLCATSKANFLGCVNNENNVDVSVYLGDTKQGSCGKLQLTYGLEQSDQIYTLICNIEGDIVKLTKNKGYLVVYEIAVLKVNSGTLKRSWIS